jgi:uncharacterized membrane protein (UPF0127 family)
VTGRRPSAAGTPVGAALPLAGFGAVLLLSGCSSEPSTVSVDGTDLTVQVEVADSVAERSTGLSGRTEVAHGTGMAFVFDEPSRPAFWMQDTLVPLSIMWVLDGTVVDVAEMAPCPPGTTCPLYAPSDPEAVFDLAVEAPGGTFTDADVRSGAEVLTTGF